MIGYKLLTRMPNGELTSCVYQPSRSPIYTPGAPTRPFEGCGPLGVFEDIKSAERFAGWMGTDKVLYRCEYILDEANKTFYGPGSGGGLWEMPRSEIPRGTRFASEVTLLEEITKRRRP